MSKNNQGFSLDFLKKYSQPSALRALLVWTILGLVIFIVFLKTVDFDKIGGRQSTIVDNPPPPPTNEFPPPPPAEILDQGNVQGLRVAAGDTNIEFVCLDTQTVATTITWPPKEGAASYLVMVTKGAVTNILGLSGKVIIGDPRNTIATTTTATAHTFNLITSQTYGWVVAYTTDTDPSDGADYYSWRNGQFQTPSCQKASPSPSPVPTPTATPQATPTATGGRERVRRTVPTPTPAVPTAAPTLRPGLTPITSSQAFCNLLRIASLATPVLPGQDVSIQVGSNDSSCNGVVAWVFMGNTASYSWSRCILSGTSCLASSRAPIAAGNYSVVAVADLDGDGSWYEPGEYDKRVLTVVSQP